MKSEKTSTPSEDFMTTVSLGERGQVVIPKEIRDEMGLEPGSRLVIMHHHAEGPIVMFPIENLRNVMKKMTSKFAKLGIS